MRSGLHNVPWVKNNTFVFFPKYQAHLSTLTDSITYAIINNKYNYKYYKVVYVNPRRVCVCVCRDTHTHAHTQANVCIYKYEQILNVRG